MNKFLVLTSTSNKRIAVRIDLVTFVKEEKEVKGKYTLVEIGNEYVKAQESFDEVMQMIEGVPYE